MTFVGKILVVVIVVLCLLCMGFAVAVYVADQQWPQQYERLRAQNDQLQSQFDVAKTQLTDLTNTLSRVQQDNQQAEVALNATIESLKSEMARLREEEARAREEAKKYEQEAALVLADVEFRRKETETLRQKLYNAIVERDQADRERIEAEDELRIAQGNLQATESRNKELLARVSQLDSILQRFGIDPDKVELAAVPPPVEGIVLRAGEDREWVEISIGSDDGLVPGHRLEVFRLQERPEQSKYLGQIEIREVDPDKAVAKVLRPFRGLIEQGDHVASRIR